MTPQPGMIGNIVPKSSDPGAIMRMIRELQQSVQALQGAQTLAAATVSSGGITIADGGALTVTDASGNPRIVLGLLADGDYGLEVIDTSGNVMPLAQLAFGAAAESTAGTFTCAGNGVWRTDSGESPLAVNVVTGRLLVIVSAVLYSSVSASDAVMSWTLTGPTNVAANAQRALVASTANNPAAGYSSGSYAFLHTGLTPGSYSIRSNYQCIQYGGTADSALFENRSVVALPF